MCFWTIRVVAAFLQRVVAGVAKGDEAAADELPELHATCAGLKATCTGWAHACVEDCRKACGGQGVLRSSGIADNATMYAGAVTAEGEQIILGLQTARYLIKTVAQLRDGRGAAVPSSVQYLGDEPLHSVRLDTTPPEELTSVLCSLLRDRARRVAHDLEEDFAGATRDGKAFDAALNSVAVLAYHSAECHCKHVMARNMAAALANPKYVPDGAVRAALTRVLQLAALQIIRESGGDFCAVLDPSQQRWVLRRINQLLDELRPDAVALTDGWGYLDSSLKSTLGRHDGNVYEAIYSEAKKSPLNTAAKMVGWDALAPQLDLDFMRQTMTTQRQGAKL